VNARLSNTSLRAAVALLGALALAFGVAACGSSGPSGQTLVNDTFSSHSPIESAKVDLSLSFTPTGSGASSSKALSLSLSGPFQNAGPSKLPHFSLKVALNAGGHPIQAGATATGSQLFVELGGSWYEAPEATYKAIEQGYAQATKGSQSRSTFSSLGIEPRKWLANPSNEGTTNVAGTETYHVSADVNTNAFLQDVSKLSQSAGPVGSSVPGLSALSPSAVSELGHAIHSAHVDIYTGKSDHVLRRLELTAKVGSTTQTQAFLNGASEAEVKLQLQFAELNQPQDIAAPPHAKPFSQLLPALEQVLGTLQQSSGGSGSPLGG
jgi:hypothetical protein